MDFLGPAQPRRDRGGAGHHRAVDRRAARHGGAAARRRDDLRDARRAATRSACSSSSPTACARPCEGASPPSSTTSSRSSRSTGRGRCATSTPTRATSATRTRCSYSDERLRRSPSRRYGVILYQEQSMQIAKAIAGFTGPRGGRPAQGDRQEAARAAWPPCATASSRAPARTGTSEAVIEDLWAVNEAAADYSFNRSHAACYALITYRTAWLKANYPAEYMAALISLGHVHQGQGAVLRRPVRGHGHRGAAARREHVGARLQGRRAATSASASTR